MSLKKDLERLHNDPFASSGAKKGKAEGLKEEHKRLKMAKKMNDSRSESELHGNYQREVERRRNK